MIRISLEEGVLLVGELVWDRQLEEDVRAGKLDALADEALRVPAPTSLRGARSR